MSDATRQPTQSLHFLGLSELLYAFNQFLPCFGTFERIADGAFEHERSELTFNKIICRSGLQGKTEPPFFFVRDCRV